MKVLTRKLLVILVVLFLIASSNCRKKRTKKGPKRMVLRQKETNPADFIRIAVMRLVYGIATRIGFGEQISEALNGAFVPPGADDYDFGDDDSPFSLFDRGDDYDY